MSSACCTGLLTEWTSSIFSIMYSIKFVLISKVLFVDDICRSFSHLFNSSLVVSCMYPCVFIQFIMQMPHSTGIKCYLMMPETILCV